MEDNVMAGDGALWQLFRLTSGDFMHIQVCGQ